MRIAYFSDTYLPTKNGVATVVSYMKKGLEEKGHEVYLFAPSGGEEKNVWVSPSIRLLKKIEILYSFPDVKKIRALIQELKPDLIHTHTEFNMGRIGKKLALEMRIPWVHTCHTLWSYYAHYIPLPFVRFFTDLYLKSFYKEVPYFTFPSSKSKDAYESFSHHLIESRVISNGIDPKLFFAGLKESREELRAKMGYGLEDMVILYVGRVAKEKNFQDMLEHMIPVLKKNPSFHFLIIGQGGLVEKTLARIKEEKLEAQIKHILRVPWQEISSYYTMGDIFTILSVSDTNPLVTIEAAQCSLAIIAIRDQAFSNIVFDGENGFLIDQALELQEKITLLGKDRKLLHQFQKRSKEIGATLTIENTVNHLEDFYREIQENELEKTKMM